MSSEEEEWVPVVIRHHGPAFEREVYETYQVNQHCQIRNTKTKKVMSAKNEQVGLYCGGEVKMLRRHRLCLASFYPTKIPDDISLYDVDHIDGEHSNNVLSNLQWTLKSDHSRKTMAQTMGSRKSIVEKQGKKVKVVEVGGDGDVGLLGRVFMSVTYAASELNLTQSSISNSSKNGHWVGGKYKFEFVGQPLLPGEIFTPLGDYGVSNKGRVRMKSGKVTNGTNLTGSKYRTVRIKLEDDDKKRNYLIHILVWLAHRGPIPEDMVVMHSDTYPTLDGEGRERNHLEDLSLGTQRENMQSHHDNRKGQKRVRCIDSGVEYPSGATAAKELGLYHGSVHLVCQKKQKTTKGYRFEYV